MDDSRGSGASPKVSVIADGADASVAPAAGSDDWRRAWAATPRGSPSVLPRTSRQSAASRAGRPTGLGPRPAVGAHDGDERDDPHDEPGRAERPADEHGPVRGGPGVGGARLHLIE